MGDKIKICELCGSDSLKPVLNLGLHPLCDDLIQIGSSEVSLEYPIEILFCQKCYTAHQKFHVNRELLFPINYHYRARMTGSVLSGMHDLVEECKSHFGSLVGLKVLDIGCNDGSLLNYFLKNGADVFGVEPTNAAKDAQIPVIQKFFDDKIIEEILVTFGEPDLIIFTNVFAHIENLPELIQNLMKIMKESTVLVVENHYLGAVIKFGQFDTFYHEHPRTYSARSFDFIADKMGRAVIRRSFVSRYGGNIRVFIGKPFKSQSSLLTDPENEDRFYEGFGVLNQFMKKWVKEEKYKIENLNKIYGPLPAKAFPGRAAILIKLLNLTEFNISAVYEIAGSIKVGNYVPGTRIPILPEIDLFETLLEFPLILNLAWHIPKEVELNLRNNGFLGKVINVMDFNERY